MCDKRIVARMIEGSIRRRSMLVRDIPATNERSVRFTNSSYTKGMLEEQVLLAEFPFLCQSVAWLQTHTSGSSHGKLSQREKIMNAVLENEPNKPAFPKMVARTLILILPAGFHELIAPLYSMTSSQATPRRHQGAALASLNPGRSQGSTLQQQIILHMTSIPVTPEVALVLIMNSPLDELKNRWET